MKLSVNWLNEIAAFDRPVDEMASALTMAGLEVEESDRWTREDFVKAGGAGLADDVVWNVKVTPNRGDWLSMLGVGRECAALAGIKAKIPKPRVYGKGEPASHSIKIRIDDADLCGRYVGAVVRGAKIKESPDWMKDRLIAAGMRPINNVVDITNFVMLELGQPLHAFDLRLLRDAQIIVRRAKPGEKIISLDGAERELDPEMLVIADAERAVAIAGVMGGLDSEISEQTQDILIEAANFSSSSIRRTAKRLSMMTESSYRFERGVDPSITADAAARAAELICELAGGEAAGGLVDVHPVVVEPRTVAVRPERANAILGASLNAEQMVGYLRSYEIEAEIRNGVLHCTVPTFRSDLTCEIDLIEEVGRAYGYDNIAQTLPAKSLPGTDSPVGKLRDRIRRILMGCGGQEVLTHSLVDGRLAELAGMGRERITLRNPLSEETDSMRVTLIPNLLQVLQRNQASGTPSLSVFEIGKVYYRTSDGGLDEKLSISGAMVGDLWAGSWGKSVESLDVDYFLCKGAVESLFSELNVSGVEFTDTRNAILHPTRAAKLSVGGRDIGILGEVSPDVCDALDVRGRPCVFEIDFDLLMQCVPEQLVYREIARYPATDRHLSIAVSRDVKYEAVERAVRESGGELVESVKLLDVYTGEQLGENRQSLTLSVVFRSREKTLTDEEVGASLSRIRDALTRSVGASFR
jgi:phenylalanyl-tRNA synthetase beta chain